MLRVSGNYFDDNGAGVPGTAAIDINSSSNITICGNTFHRSGGFTETTGIPISHIFFQGVVDSVSLCGNTYFPGVESQIIAVRPDYVYDADPLATLTNISIADNAAPQNAGVFTNNAAVLLGSAATPHNPRNYLTGLTLSNNGPPSLKVDIAAGEATDSTGSTIIRNSAACTVDLATGGKGGLDTGSMTVMADTTYYLFVISGYGGSSPSCMASASPAPIFVNTGSAYALQPSGNVTSGSPIVFNIGGPFPGGGAGHLTANPLGGMAVGDVITGAGIPTSPLPTTITSFQPIYSTLAGTIPGSNLTWVTSLAYVSGDPLSDLAAGMTVGNQAGASSPIPSGTYITEVCTGTGPCTCVGPCTACSPTPCMALSQSAISGSYNMVFASNYTARLSASATSDNNNTPLTVYDGYYRMVGALYTDGAPNVVQFSQDGDTFYLHVPKPDIIASLGVFPTPFTLSSVPSGVPVEAFGRCVANNKVHIFSQSLSPNVPQPFPVPPGYDTSTTTSPQTSFPYRTYTNSSQQIYAQAGTIGTSLQCMTDGWKWPRSQ